MEILLYVLMMLAVLNCAMKISLWPFWARLAFTLSLGVFAYWSIDYAMVQSKTQIDGWLHREEVLQGIAIIVTMESAIGVTYCFLCLNDDGKRHKNRFLRLLLHAYPCLLVVPVIFYCLTKFLFLQVGVDFYTSGLLFAFAVMVILSLCAEFTRWLLPANDLRVEAHLWLTAMVCLLSLLLTQSKEIIYHSNVEALDWSSMILTLSAAVFVMAVGVIGNRLKWKLKDKSRKKNNTRKWK